jgi:hypothetical protein
MMPLHDSLISLPLRNTDDIHPVALFKDINFDGLPYRHIANLLKLSEDTGGWSLGLLQMSQFGLGQLAFFHLAERQLNGFIPIALFCLDRTTRQGPASMTVTGVNRDSSNIWVIPSFLPNNPFVMRTVPCQSLPLELNLDIHAGGQVQFHQGIHGFRSRVHDVHQALVRSDFELLASLLVCMCRALHRKLLDARRKRNRPHNFRPAPRTVSTISATDWSNTR